MAQFGEYLLDRTLRAPSDEGTCRYLIVDTSATHPENFAAKLHAQGTAIDLLSGGPCNWADSVSPVLVTLHPFIEEHHAAGLTATMDRWRYANCFICVESSMDAESFAAALTRRTRVELEDGLPMLLRYFDSRIFSALLRTLDSQQRSSFLSIGSRWCFPDRSGEAHLVECRQADRDPMNATMLLSNVQQAALIDAGEADAVINILLDQQHVGLIDLLPPEQYTKVSAALTASRRWHITQVSEQVEFSALWLELGEGFDDALPWSTELPHVQSGRSSWQQVMDRVAEQSST